MQNSDKNAPRQLAPLAQGAERGPTKTIYIQGIPEWVWEHARHNALTSKMSFRDYVEHVLADSEPYPRER